tara:strand:+ start:6250 stop:7008 length:759 start_codon:yes stop_codon:yes gene_type:complete
MSDSKNWRSIRSYGIILVRKNTIGEPEFLLVCRRSTYCYVDYLLGKYNENNMEYFNFMIENMTELERNKIIENSYSDLWNELYSGTRNTNGPFYCYVQTKFQRMLGLFKKQHSILPSIYSSPEWGFPKGRLNLREDPLDCAIRELYEETRIIPEMYSIEKKILPFEEKYVGTNGIGYRNLFCVAFPKVGCKGFIDETNNAQTREIGNIKWMGYMEAMKSFRLNEKSKKCILEKVFQSVLELHNNRSFQNMVL